MSTWSVHRSHPTVGCRRHGIVQHWQRKPTSVWRRTLTSFGFSAVSVSSFFYVVSLSWLLYAAIYVVLPLLPTFLDPPWLLLSSHPARFDQPVVPFRTIVDLHHLHGRTSAFKNCLFGGSLSSILPIILRWLSSAIYYDCINLGCVHLGPFVPAVYWNSNPLWEGDDVHGRSDGKMGGSHFLGYRGFMGGPCAYSGRCSIFTPSTTTVAGREHSGMYSTVFFRSYFVGLMVILSLLLCGTDGDVYFTRIMGGKRILYWIKRCSVYLLLCLPVASMGGASTWKFSLHGF